MAKHGPHIVLKVCSFWILIYLLRDVPCQISHCWVNPVAPFLEMVKIWSGWDISRKCFVEIPGILVQYLHIMRIFLFVCQSTSWLTSLLKSRKYQDVSCSGWDIFLKYFGDLPVMFLHCFQKSKSFCMCVCPLVGIPPYWS